MTFNEIVSIFNESENEIKISRSAGSAQDVLSRMGINGDSTLGQVISNAKEIYVNRYLRLCGSANIEKMNALVKKYYPGDKVVVATDVWGGIFAIGNGDFEGHPAGIWYYAPDSLDWEETELNYTEFIDFAAGDTVEHYYESWLWQDCKKYFAGKLGGLIGGVNSDQAVLVYPFVWSKEFNAESAKKETVPFEDILKINAEYEKRINN